MVATDFVTNRTLRDKYIDNVEVLDRIENVELLMPLPSTEYVTMNQIADFYQVPLETIERCYQRHESEICSDGVIVLTPKNTRNFLTKQVVLLKIVIVSTHNIMARWQFTLTAIPM